MTLIACYCRVSTRHQKNDSQRAEIERWLDHQPLDRLSRRQRDGINLLADWCERGVRVVAVTQQIDLSGSVGRMVATRVRHNFV